MKLKNNIINILAIVFGGLLFIALIGILLLILVGLMGLCGFPIDIAIGKTIISGVAKEVSFGPIAVIVLYLIGAFLTYKKIYKKADINNA